MARSIVAIPAGFILIGVLALGTAQLWRTVLMPAGFSANGATDSVPVSQLTTGYAAVSGQ